MTVQVTLGFSADTGERTGAWDEVYYSPGDNPTAVEQTWGSRSNLIGIPNATPIYQRLAMLSNQISLYYARFALVGSPRVTVVDQGAAPGLRLSDNFAGDAICFRMQSPSRQTSREIRLGGLPDNVVSGNAIDPAFVRSYVFNPADAAPVSASSTFIGQLLAVQAQIRYRTSVLGGPASYKILGAAQAGQYAPIVLTLQKALVWDLNEMLDLSTRGQPQIRGRWVVAASAVVGGLCTVTLRGSERVSCPPILTGFATRVVMDVVPLLWVGSYYLAAHKLGKKKYQRRGRSSPRLLRH